MLAQAQFHGWGQAHLRAPPTARALRKLCSPLPYPAMPVAPKYAMLPSGLPRHGRGREARLLPAVNGSDFSTSAGSPQSLRLILTTHIQCLVRQPYLQTHRWLYCLLIPLLILHNRQPYINRWMLMQGSKVGLKLYDRSIDRFLGAMSSRDSGRIIVQPNVTHHEKSR
jgi:hypothetical protein